MRYSDILLEYNRDQTVKNFGQKVLAVAIKDHTVPWLDVFQQSSDQPPKIQNARQLLQTPEGQQTALNFIMGELERSDPTRNKNYAQALTKMYTAGDTPLEDFTSTMANDLVKFDKLKNKKKIKPEHADFMRFKSARQFMDIISEYPDPDSELGSQNVAVTQIPEGLEYKIVYGKIDNELRITSDVLIIQPLNEAASQWWARGYPTKSAAQTNKWCTGQPSPSCLFNSYKRDGDLFIIIPQVRQDNDEKYQFYFTTNGGRRNEFADNSNRALTDQQLSELATRFPAITHTLKNYAVKNNILQLMPIEYKQKVGAHAQVAAKELDNTLAKFTERVARFGFAELRKPEKYNINVSPETEEAIVPSIIEYIGQVREELMSEDGLWAHIMKNLGSERNSNKIEIFLNGDKQLKQIMTSSKAAQLVKQLAAEPEIRGKMDEHHLQDVIIRDPVFRICMTQIPKLYEKFLAELDIGQLKEGKVKAVDIARQDYDTMNPQQFRGQYGQSRDDWQMQNKKMLATTQRKPKRARAPKASAVPNTVEAYIEYYDKRDQRQFTSKAFPDEASAKAWADKNNATIHSIIPLKGAK
jgi:hypothetical protein